MALPLRLLMIEDSLEDAELILLHLRTQGLDCTCVRVDSMEAFLAQMKAAAWDLVLSDFSLPDTDGMAVLERVRQLEPDLPFILMSGVLD